MSKKGVSLTDTPGRKDFLELEHSQRVVQTADALGFFFKDIVQLENNLQASYEVCGYPLLAELKEDLASIKEKIAADIVSGVVVAVGSALNPNDIPF